MLEWLTQIFDNANTTTQKGTKDINTAQVNAFRTELNNNNPLIRLYVGTGGSWGNQAATVNVLRRIVDPLTDENLTFNYSGTIEVYYAGGDTTLQKLYNLLPEMNGQPEHGIKNATVKLIAFNAQQPPVDNVNFGLTGAIDSNTTDLAAALNVNYFVQLQPYNYTNKDSLWFKGGRDKVDLDEVPALNNPAFKRRVFFVPPSTYNNPDWSDYDTDGAKVLKFLTGEDMLKRIRLVVSYIIMPPLENVINSSPQAAAAILSGSLLQWQNKGNYRYAAPVVVINLKPWGTPDDDSGLQKTEGFLEGTMTSTEAIMIANGNQKTQRAFDARAKYMKSLDARNRWNYLNYPDLTAAQNAVGSITGKDDQVLFIQLGPLPQPLYYYALFKTNMFSIFEGANSMLAAINMGKSFLNAPRMGSPLDSALYPNINRGLFSSSPPITDLASAANQLNYSLDNWPTANSKNPCVQMGSFLQTLTNQVSVSDPIPKYFTDIKNFYATSDQDKMNVALAYMMNIYQQDHPTGMEVACFTDVLLNKDENPLNALCKELQEKVKIGEKLDLIPGVIAGGNINTILLNLLKGLSATLWLEVETFSNNCGDDVKEITLTGSTGVFKDLNVTNTIAIIFDAPDNKLRTSVKFGTLDPEKKEDYWSIPGAPWIQMWNPYLKITVSDGQIPVTAEMGGTYKPINADLKVLLPVAQDQWLTTVSFSKNYPGIASIFQMAASVNLVQLMPPPINTLVDLGLKQVDFYYDYKNKTVPALGFIIANNSSDPLPLIGKIALGDIEVQVALTEPLTPKTMKTRASATGKFTIGTGEDKGVIAVNVQYPNWQFQGGLESGEIKFADILDTFIPGVSLELPGLPTITEFNFNYLKESDLLTVAMKLNIDWDFEFFGKNLFTIKDVGFSVSREKVKNTGNVTGNVALFKNSGSEVDLNIGAYYLGESNWQFIAKQTGGEFDIPELVKYYLEWQIPDIFPKVDGLSLTLDWGKQGTSGSSTSFEFTAKTASRWYPLKEELPDVYATGSLMLGYNGKKGAGTGKEPVPLADSKPVGSYGKLSATINLWKINLEMNYNFDPDVKNLCITWLFITGCIGTNKEKETIATFKLNGKSIGEMVEMFVSWATGAKFGLVAPWNVLDSFTLNAFEVIYNFTKKKVSFKIGIGPIDLGLFTINGISLTYNPENTDSKVEISIDGSFVWQSGDSLSWDPTKPECTPAPPGGGNKYLDLRLLALGQHVTVNGLTDQRQVQDVIKMLRDLEIPTPPDIPVGGPNQPVFAPNNSWFVAMDFGVLKTEKPTSGKALPAAAGSNLPVSLADEEAAEYFIQLSLVFNDPILYALRIALAGPMAKIFKGLDFQIMYRQVSDNVGCYSAQIALPDIMRKFQVGVATITLPNFAIDIYTNGDFQVDIGFPWNEDFARSFTIEVIVYPGIPILGSAGFYFGKLSSATTDKVPKATNGWFNPVIVFGFGAQLGLGKSIELGILKAGFSLTIFGIIEGVLARFLPYKAPTEEGLPMELQDGFYFSLSGTVGVQGRLYGTIDFAIIKADVNIAIKLFLKIVFAAYEDIPITAQASVRVSVKVSINLGLFKISISLSFSATVKATFVLKNPMGSNPPWVTDGTSVSTRALHMRRMKRAQYLFAAPTDDVSAYTFNPVWSNLEPGTQLKMAGYLAPVLSVAGDEASQPTDQEVIYVANFFLETPAPVQKANPKTSAQKTQTIDGAVRVVEEESVAHEALARANERLAVKRSLAGDSFSDTFEDLAIRILQWVIAAGMDKMTPDQVNQQVVTHDYLSSAMDYLSNATAIPIPTTDVNDFLNNQTAFLFTMPSDDKQVSTVFFPAPPGAALNVGDYGDWKGFNYSFGSYNSSSDKYLQGLNDYFKQLKIQVEQEENGSQAKAMADTSGSSIADFVFGDYFALVATQALQALINGLDNFKWVINEKKKVGEIVKWVNDTGNLSGDDIFSAGMLFAANKDHNLKADRAFTISGMTWTSPGGASFTDIAEQKQFNKQVDATKLAELNAANSRILAANVTVTYNNEDYLTLTGDSLDSIAKHFKIDVPTLLKDTDVLKDQALIEALAIVTIPGFSYKTGSSVRLSSIAGQFGISLDFLADANTDKKDIFDNTQDPNLNIPGLLQFQVGALIEEAERTLGLQNLGAMASRYYLHGLRLPTEGLTANARGLFVTGSEGSYKYPAQLGLFALTGQAFPLPDIKDPSGKKSEDPQFSFTITRGSETWYSLGAEGSTSVTFNLTDKDDYQRYRDVWNFAKANVLDTEINRVAPLAAAEAQPSRFPLSQEISWQTTVAVTLAHQTVTPDNPEPRLWTFPDALVNTPHENGVLPLMKAVLAQTDEATGTTKDVEVDNYGFGTLINFKIRTIQPVVDSPTTEKLYEIIAASTKDIILLERLLNQLQGSDSGFQQMVLLYPPQGSSSDVQGWQMDDPKTSLMGISQVNLSTETRPPTFSQASLEAMTDDDTGLGNVINLPTEFLRLLWEASITRQGGFYLSYISGIGGDSEGLPDHIFNDHNEADIAVLALFKSTGSEGQNVTNYMNSAATNQPLDLDNAALIAQVIPVETTSDKTAITVKPSDTLVDIAELFYMDPGLLVSLNLSTPLKTGVTITVAGGTYEVPPSGVAPGGVLQDIANYFNTSVDGIKTANHLRTGWPDPLPLYTGLKLPDVEIEIGKTYNNGKVFTTFGDLASYYNAPGAELAAVNKDKTGLFSEGTVLNLTIGPNSLSPVLQAGVAGIDLARSAPPDLPQLPTDADWGRIYLLHLFNLLGYRIAGNHKSPPYNPYFNESNWGLPAGPSYEDGSTSVDKIQAARALTEGDEWVYTQAVPYPALYADKKIAISPTNGLPPKEDNPYWGVGGLLQLELEWLDIFGNEILSHFNAPQAGSLTPLNFPPQVTGYTDRLLGVGQWPAVANAYRFLPDKEGKPTLEMMLAFDKSAYEEASSALNAGDEEQKLKIELALKAYQQVWYQLKDPNDVTVTLTSTVTPGVPSLIPGTDVEKLIVWVESIYNFLLSLLPGASSTVKQKAADFNPEFSLTIDVDISQLNGDEIFKVSTYLNFTRSAALVDGELSTSAGVTAVSSALAPWTGSLTKNEVTTEAHKRFMAAAGIIPPDTKDSDSEQRELSAFAAAFKTAFASISGVSLEITTSSDRDIFSSTSTGCIWAVQFGGKDTEKDISYVIENEGNPKLYAPRPISNKLESKPNTPIIPYETGKVISLEDQPQYKTFTSVDLDQWMSYTLGQVDELLSPKFVAPALVLKEKTGSDTMQKVLDAKKHLASGLKTTMIPVYADETADDPEKESIRETFYQTMLGTLSNFYSVKAGIQFKADVNAAIKKQADAVEPPRLYGDIGVQGTGHEGSDILKNISLSSPKLQLKFKDQDDNDPRYLSFLLSSTAITADLVTLNLDYNGQYIEHQVGQLKGIDGYQPSSWLSFVNNTQDDSWPLTKPLGKFDVPIVLREFPATPTLVEQDVVSNLSSPCYTPANSAAAATAGSGDDCSRPGDYNPLTAITLWNYGFTYSQRVHTFQDKVHCKLVFNIQFQSNDAFLGAGERDLFDNLAEFTQVYPGIHQDLDTYLATLEFATTDKTRIDNAQAALESAANIIQWVADSVNNSLSLQSVSKFLKTTSLPAYEFSLAENKIQKTDPDGTIVKALEVTVELGQDPPARVSTPLVQIEPDTYECEPEPGNGDKTYKFCYKDKKTGKYLEAKTALSIAERQFVLPDMGILERQDVETSIYLKRNEEFGGRYAADPFVYTTPTVHFTNPLLPTLQFNEPINLATIYAKSKSEPVTRSLTCQLTVFYKALFQNTVTDNVSIEMTVHYEYAISSQVQKIQLPVELMPPTLTDLTGSASGSDPQPLPLDKVIADQVKGIDTWFKTHKPKETDGSLVFNVTIMSTLTAKPMPLLKLTNLYVDLDNLEPKPGASNL